MASQALKHIHIERDRDNIAWLTFDQQDSRANVLGTEMFAELDAALDTIQKDPPAGLVFGSAKPSGFIVGADVKAFMRVDTEAQAREIMQTGQSMFNRIEALPVPTVAMIHGFCLGGGMELALACDYRIACEDEPTRLGLPEVLLGIHPGFGGTVRLIRLIGVLRAMPIMLRGRSTDARKSKRLGLVDEAVPRRHLRFAAVRRIKNKPAITRAGWPLRLLNHGLLRPIIAAIIHRQVGRKTNRAHYPAPFALVDLWRRHGNDAQAMLAGEAESIAGLFIEPTAKRLVRVFLLQERLKRLGVSQSGYTCRHVHVIGAGVMGGDIAAWCAYKGLRVTLQDREPKYLGPAVKRASKLFGQRIKDRYDRRAAMDRLIPDHKGHGIEHADVVIEAIIEDLDAKVGLYQSILPRMKADAVLATNTSSIPLQTLAARLAEPSRLIGLHFFNPVAKMQLVEVIQTEGTDPEQIRHGMVFTRRIERLPLPVRSAPGFLVNRVLLPYLIEAVILLEEGVAATDIDRAATRFGMPMGPILLADTVGLDICNSVAKILAAAIGMEVPDILEKKVTQGELGRKTGGGFYRYKKGRPVDTGSSSGKTLPEVEIQERLILRMLNECVTCLREGIVEDAALLDAGMIFGTGFAPFRGGPMHYLEDRGISDTHKLLQELHDRYGDRFKADPGWPDVHKLI
ncbi:MAG: 3-hydroxyacyl-CoA dehydrogenase NAD-binding domain-containing protein [Thiotrichales bacterium]|nr:3-hydroxyacyl-CoA dehydrogenase NAD-binding domain-containing protein [Thiotrichales bacterium]